jgi:hypothetical protein
VINLLFGRPSSSSSRRSSRRSSPHSQPRSVVVIRSSPSSAYERVRGGVSEYVEYRRPVRVGTETAGVTFSQSRGARSRPAYSVRDFLAEVDQRITSSADGRYVPRGLFQRIDRLRDDAYDSNQELTAGQAQRIIHHLLDHADLYYDGGAPRWLRSAIRDYDAIAR